MSADLDNAPGAPRVVPVTGVSAHLLAGPHPAESGERDAIAREWNRALAEKPKMFDGRVLLAETAEAIDGVFNVAFRAVGFSLMIWRRTISAETRPLLNVFGAAAVVSCDGAVLLGRMADHTANAGRVYFPCGTPDLGDVVDETVDLDGSIARELLEETGLSEPDVFPTDHRLAVFHGPLAAYIRVYRTALEAEALLAKANAHLAADLEPELSEVVMRRRGDPLGPEIPPYAQAAIETILAPD